MRRHIRQDKVLIHGENPVAEQKEVPLAAILIRLTRASSGQGVFGVFDSHRVRLCVCCPSLFVELFSRGVTGDPSGGVTNSRKSLVKGVCSGPICCTVEAVERAFPATKCEVVPWVETT